MEIVLDIKRGYFLKVNHQLLVLNKNLLDNRVFTLPLKRWMNIKWSTRGMVKKPQLL